MNSDELPAGGERCGSRDHGVAPPVSVAKGAQRYGTADAARGDLDAILASATTGEIVTIEHNGGSAAVIDAHALRALLAIAADAQIQLGYENGEHFVILHNVGLHSTGRTEAEAVVRMVEELRVYAADWRDHLSRSDNHAIHWRVVQFVEMCGEDNLIDWLESPDLIPGAR